MLHGKYGSKTQVDSTFWKGRRALITGHTGFKGSWLSLYLKMLGSELYGYSLEPETNPSLFKEAMIDNLMSKSLFGDINDLSQITSFLKESQPSVLFHLAAQPIVRESFLNPIETLETNIIGTAKVIKAALECDSIRSIVIITSDKCYKNQDRKRGYIEEDPLGGDDPYSASKAAAEIITQSFRQSFFNESSCKMATVRAGNVIGGGDWANYRLIPDVINAFRNEQVLSIRNPSAIRPWQHVLEPLTGYISLAEKLTSKDRIKYEDAWNFGPDELAHKNVEQLVKTISRYWEGNTDWEILQEGPKETELLFLDSSKSRKLLDWSPVLDFDESIKLTIDWYKSFYEGSNARDLTNHQIEQYLDQLN